MRLTYYPNPMRVKAVKVFNEFKQSPVVEFQKFQQALLAPFPKSQTKSYILYRITVLGRVQHLQIQKSEINTLLHCGKPGPIKPTSIKSKITDAQGANKECNGFSF